MNGRTRTSGNHHSERAATLIAHEAAGFIAREAGTESLITVTRAQPSKNGEQVTVFVTVLPDDRERAALAFLGRQREAFSDHLKAHTRLSPLPRVDFELDRGEKNRRRLDEIA